MAVVPKLKPLPLYQTWIPGRKEEYKLHTAKGHVKNAIIGCCYNNPQVLSSDAYVYFWYDHLLGWIPVAHYKKGTLREDLHLD